MGVDKPFVRRVGTHFCSHTAKVSKAVTRSGKRIEILLLVNSLATFLPAASPSSFVKWSTSLRLSPR
jgi:hypothetical protein